MANRFWNPAGSPANWGDTSSWAATDGGATGVSVPISSDPVFFTATNNNNCVLNAIANCFGITFVDAVAGDYSGTVSGTSALRIYGNGGNVVLSGTATYNNTGTIEFYTSNASHSFTSNGHQIKSQLGQSTGLNGNLTFVDAFDNTLASSSKIILGQSFTNSFDFNGQTIKTGGMQINNNATSTVTFNNGTVECNTWTMGDACTLVVDTGTITINSNVQSFFSGGGHTYNIVNYNVAASQLNPLYGITGTASTIATLNILGTDVDKANLSVECDLTVTDLTITGTSAARPVTLFSYSRIQRTVTVTNAPTLIDVLFGDIALSGAGAPYSGTRLGDRGNTSGITFAGAVNRYWVAFGGTSAGDYNDTNHWSASSGGAGGASVPFPHDNIYFDANSIDAISRTITFNYYSIGNIDFTGATNSPTISSVNNHFVGNTTLISAMTLTGTFFFAYSSNVTFTTADVTIGTTVTFLGKTGTTLTTVNIIFSGAMVQASGNVTMGDDIISTGAYTLTAGTLTNSTWDFQATGFYSNNVNVRGIVMGSGEWRLTGTSVWATATVTNLTFDAGSSSIVINNATATAKTFSGGGLTFNNIQFTGSGTGALTIAGSNTFNIFTVDTAPKTVKFTLGTTQTVSSLVATGSAGNLITLNSTVNGSTWTINDSAGTNDCYYLSLRDSTAGGGATWNAWDSVDTANNNGWNFLTTPSSGGFMSLNTYYW